MTEDPRDVEWEIRPALPLPGRPSPRERDEVRRLLVNAGQTLGAVGIGMTEDNLVFLTATLVVRARTLGQAVDEGIRLLARAGREAGLPVGDESQAEVEATPMVGGGFNR